MGLCIGYNFYNCIITISEPESLVRCLAFVGPMLSCGDFGGSIHTWELEIASQPDNAKKNPAFKVSYIKKRAYDDLNRSLILLFLLSF